MRFLLTGGLGVIGSLIARKLIAQGDEVEIVDSAEEPRNEWIAREFTGRRCVRRARIEKMPPSILEGLVDDVDAVIHCAASTGIPYSVTQPLDDWERNVDATRALLEALRKHPKPTVVLSSIKPYSLNHLPREGLNESMVLAPDEPYAASKAAQSMLCMAYARSYDLPIVTFRCSNLVGPAPCHGPRHGAWTWLCISAAIGRTLQVQGNGKQTRDLLHAYDVYSACMDALENVDNVKGGIFNLGGGPENRTSVLEWATALHEKTGVDMTFAPARAMDDEHVYVDIAAFSRMTGWKPRISPREIMDDVLSWAVRNAGDLKMLYRDVI